MAKYIFRGKTFSGNYIYGDLTHRGNQTYVNRVEVYPDSVSLFLGYDKNNNSVYSGDFVSESNCVYPLNVSVPTIARKYKLGDKFENLEQVENSSKESYVLLAPDDLSIITDTLIIKWLNTYDGIVLSLSYDSTTDEEIAYNHFVNAIDKAARNNVIPSVLANSYWYTWEEITKNSDYLSKQYSVIYSPNDPEVVCSLYWKSTYSPEFFAR